MNVYRRCGVEVPHFLISAQQETGFGYCTPQKDPSLLSEYEAELAVLDTVAMKQNRNTSDWNRTMALYFRYNYITRKKETWNNCLRIF